MEILAFAIVVLAIPTLGVAYLVKKTHDKDLNEWNKENNGCKVTEGGLKFIQNISTKKAANEGGE